MFEARPEIGDDSALQDPPDTEDAGGNLQLKDTTAAPRAGWFAVDLALDSESIGQLSRNDSYRVHLGVPVEMPQLSIAETLSHQGFQGSWDVLYLGDDLERSVDGLVGIPAFHDLPIREPQVLDEQPLIERVVEEDVLPESLGTAGKLVDEAN